MEILVRPIQNEDDYNAALADVERLMDAAPGTAEGARLDVSVRLIEAYEVKWWAIDWLPGADLLRQHVGESKELE